MAANDLSKPRSSLRALISRESRSRSPAGNQPQRTPESEDRPKSSLSSHPETKSFFHRFRKPKIRSDPLQSPTSSPSSKTNPTLRLDVPDSASSDHRQINSSSVAAPDVEEAEHGFASSSRSRDKESAASMAKTAFEAFKLALSTMGTASQFVPHGSILSSAITGVLMAIEVVEVGITTSI